MAAVGLIQLLVGGLTSGSGLLISLVCTVTSAVQVARITTLEGLTLNEIKLRIWISIKTIIGLIPSQE